MRHQLSTIMNERDHTAAPVIEQCLSHTLPGIAGVYNRATYVAQRAKVMQGWADVLDGLRATPHE